MKYFKTLNTYKGSNVTFNEQTLEAYSYGWWRFYDKGLFNNCNFSPTTTKHQYKVKSLLEKLGLNITLELKFTTKGFQSGYGYGQDHGIELALNDEIHLTNEKIKELEALIKKPRTTAKKNQERKEHIKELLTHLENVTNYLTDYKAV